MHQHPRDVLRQRLLPLVDIRTIYSPLEEHFTMAANATIEAAREGLIFACGNGGSFSDADHTIGELVGWYADKTRQRPGIRAVLLGGSSASLTAIANDTSYEQIFARQLEPYGPFLQQVERPGVLLAFTTSGNSPNVLAAARVAQQHKINVVGFLGNYGGKMVQEGLVTYPLIVPTTTETARIQEIHHMLYHALCDVVEQALQE